MEAKTYFVRFGISVLFFGGMNYLFKKDLILFKLMYKPKWFPTNYVFKSLSQSLRSLKCKHFNIMASNLNKSHKRIGIYKGQTTSDPPLSI